MVLASFGNESVQLSCLHPGQRVGWVICVWDPHLLERGKKKDMQNAEDPNRYTLGAKVSWKPGTPSRTDSILSSTAHESDRWDLQGVGSGIPTFPSYRWWNCEPGRLQVLLTSVSQPLTRETLRLGAQLCLISTGSILGWPLQGGLAMRGLCCQLPQADTC